MEEPVKCPVCGKYAFEHWNDMDFATYADGAMTPSKVRTQIIAAEPIRCR